MDLSTNTLTVVRGANGTPVTTHSAGAGVYLATDQRGVPRSTTPDLGAYQSQGSLLSLSPPTLPPATVGQVYQLDLGAAGGSGHYAFTLAAGSLPGGFSLSASGVLSGTPSISTNFRFILRATDTVNPALTGTLFCVFTVNPPFPLSGSLSNTGNTKIAGTYSGTTIYYEFSADTTGDLSVLVTSANGAAYLPQVTLYGNEGQLLIQADAANAGLGDRPVEPAPPTGQLCRGHFRSQFVRGQSRLHAGVHLHAELVGISVAAPGRGCRSHFRGNGGLQSRWQSRSRHRNVDGDSVSILLGLGDGTFAPAVSYPIGFGPVSVAVGHFTADGNLDIVTANYYDDTVSVLLGNGDGTFRPDPYRPPAIRRERSPS